MEVFGLILTYDLSNTAMLFVFVCFTRLLFLAMTKYVTKSPMKIMMTSQFKAVYQIYSSVCNQWM